MGYISLPELAEHMRGWFPEFSGRVFAALGDNITKDNMPALPLIALITGATSIDSHQYKSGAKGYVDAAEDFNAEFWLKTEYYKKADGSQSPFWSYYDYQPLMRRLLARIMPLGAEHCVRFEFLGVEIAPDPASLVIACKFRQHYRFVPADYHDETISFRAAPIIGADAFISTAIKEQ